MNDSHDSTAPGFDSDDWTEVPESDFGANEYFALPDSGVGHYNLEDAALLAALNMWSAGQVPGVPAGEGWPEADGPRVRKGIEPLQRQLLEALTRSVERGLLKAAVRRRTLPDSQPVPRHTFVRLTDLEDWLEVHGHMRGPVMEAAAAAFVDNPWGVACAVARDRAELRHPSPTQPQQHGSDVAAVDEVTRLKRELQEARLHVLHLQRQDERRRGAGRRRDDLGTRERATLLKLVVGMAIDAYRFDPAAARTTVPKDIAEAFSFLPWANDIAVTDDTVRKYLKEATETVLTRKPD